jgi:hypothetical protein
MNMETLRRAALIALTIGVCLLPGHVASQELDICGCAAIPDLPAFDTRTPSTYPPGTIVNGQTLSIPVPDDGVLRFSSMFVNLHLTFTRNAANTPVTILVQGNAEFDNSGCCLTVVVSGHGGTTGSSNAAGVGGLGGPGGSRGGDGAAFGLYGASIGGAGFGAGGGLGGDPVSNGCTPAGGQFFGSPDLVPLVGGSGGGGGCSASTSPTCGGGGGGGGGGGALMLAVNGVLRINNFQFVADGAGGGSDSGATCASTGSGGAGGAFRMLARQLVSVGRAEFYARGADGGTPGRIRLESLDASAQTAFATDPGAQRIVGPTPLANPLAPSVSITNVGGVATPVVPLGAVGAVDVIVPVPGATNVNVTTRNVPGGTMVQVTVKPRMGGHPISENVNLASCNGAGECQASATFNLAAGTYVVEARATYRTQ